jgi:hypothetical protein
VYEKSPQHVPHRHAHWRCLEYSDRWEGLLIEDIHTSHKARIRSPASILE